MPDNKTSLQYKTYCWNIGTTSFRTRLLNHSIERQLLLLGEFRAEHNDWTNDSQRAYYDLMHRHGFTTGEEARPDKAARQKTSALVDLGIIDDDRRLTDVGQALLDIANQGRHTLNGLLQLPPDGLVYLQQLLKTACPIDAGTVRPLPIVLHLLAELGTLTEEEFTYLAPLATTPETTAAIISGIRDIRNGQRQTDDVIYDLLISRDNYKQARQEFLEANTVTAPLMCRIGINRKSRKYDKVYLPLYTALRQVFLAHDYTAAEALFAATTALTNVGKAWRALLFDTTSLAAVKAEPQKHIRQCDFTDASNERQLRERFFRTMHVIKARYTLHDYADLNRRYLRLTNIFLFADGKVELDIVPKHFFRRHDTALFALAFTPASDLQSLTPLEAICPELVPDEATLLDDINAELGCNATDTRTARQAVQNIRYRRLAILIKQRFSDEQLLTLLDDFESRNDNRIAAAITDNADAPTCFEYVLAIIWYKVSGCRGQVLDYMKLSLDADLLPVSHAAGGEADIVYQYDATDDYPAHHLLLEATLAASTGQRRMEMEPVSRHLGTHLLRNNVPSYAVFATTHLDPNVVSDFKARKHIPFLDPADPEHTVPGMMIIPINTTDLRHIITRHTPYRDLYCRYRQAHAVSDRYPNPLTWRKETIAAGD